MYQFRGNIMKLKDEGSPGLTKAIRNLNIPTIAIIEKMLHHIAEKKDVVPIRRKESMPLRAQSNQTIDKRSKMFTKFQRQFKTTG